MLPCKPKTKTRYGLVNT